MPKPKPPQNQNDSRPPTTFSAAFLQLIWGKKWAPPIIVLVVAVPAIVSVITLFSNWQVESNDPITDPPIFNTPGEINSNQTAAVPKNAPITVATKGWAGYAPLYVASEMKLIDGERIDFVEVTDVEDMMDHLHRTNGKTADVGAWLVDTHVLAREDGISAVAILKMDQSLAADALITSVDITDFKQLKGKRIAYQRCEPSHSLLLLLCDANDMTLQSFEETVETTPKGAVNLFRNGAVDAAISYDPWLAQAEAAMNTPGEPKVVGRGFDGSDSEQLGHPIIDILVAREDYLKSNPDKIRSLINGWFRAVDLLTDLNDAQHSTAVQHFCAFMTQYAPKLNGTPYNYEDFKSLTDPTNMRLAGRSENKQFFESTGSQGFSEFRLQLDKSHDLWHSLNRSMLGGQEFEAKSTAEEAGDGSKVLLEYFEQIRKSGFSD